jgi:hypothetical protein
MHNATCIEKSLDANYNSGVSAADGKHHYLRNWTWWAGIGTSIYQDFRI